MGRGVKKRTKKLSARRRADTTTYDGVYFSPSPYMPPDSPGMYQFAVLFTEIASTKNKWTYCSELHKLYIVWHQVIPLEFRWLQIEPGLMVRALLVYSDIQYFHEPVQRCLVHLDYHDPSNEGFDYMRHVIRCENPGALYDEDPNTGRCSVVAPLGEPQPGTGTVTVTYKFMCKTSCVAGMSRRPMALVFTLERADGFVLGRHSVGIKVCSCPRRDMEKEVLILRRHINNSLKRENTSPYRFEIMLPDVEIFKKILEFNHGGVTSLLRTTPITDPRYSQLTAFLTLIEDKLSSISSRLSQWYGQ